MDQSPNVLGLGLRMCAGLGLGGSGSLDVLCLFVDVGLLKWTLFGGFHIGFSS
jgi:hypothetical protein